MAIATAGNYSDRKWLRPKFSLRTLLISITLFCIVFNWSIRQRELAIRQKRAVVEVARCGGSVSFSFQLEGPSGRDVPHAEPWAPRWLRKSLGEDYFRCAQVVAITASQTLANDDLCILQDLPDLPVLAVCHSQSISDQGLKHLAGLSEMRQLTLSGTSVEGYGLRELSALSNLESIDLSGSPVTDAGMQPLANAVKVRWLNLRDTNISDYGLVHLSRLPVLEWIQLANTAITDAGLEHFEHLPGIRGIHLIGTKVSPEGAKRLRQILPNCVVAIDPPP